MIHVELNWEVSMDKMTRKMHDNEVLTDTKIQAIIETLKDPNIPKPEKEKIRLRLKKMKALLGENSYHK